MRCVSTTGGEQGTAEENNLRLKLEQGLNASLVQVRDTSGGCGSFYAIYVVSDKFNGVRLIDQHRMVKDLLQSEVKSIHGLTLTTKTPASHQSSQ